MPRRRLSADISPEIGRLVLRGAHVGNLQHGSSCRFDRRTWEKFSTAAFADWLLLGNADVLPRKPLPPDGVNRTTELCLDQIRQCGGHFRLHRVTWRVVNVGAVDLGAELIQQEARVAAMTFFCVVVWLCELAGALLFPIVIPLAREYTFTLFIGYPFHGKLYWVEDAGTKGKTVQEIQQVSTSKKSSIPVLAVLALQNVMIFYLDHILI
ncbi:hypothetical protein BV898_10420 [Hypsibius exemplaris]|uniref:Uncharacterized protein n=1 Tax=Hypsibius exemplaris TaxID=2072580 RepID=A0A1W0WJL4_HYPEX|nr:hypothetical protein BV898_10420 [Hypsibius exemplaris]